MARPTFLVVEPEPGHALSSRKLVLETAKYNVLTAHSWGEAGELFARFSQVDAVIVTSDVDEGVPCTEFVRMVKEQSQRPQVIVLSASESAHCNSADHCLSTHEPHSLVDLLRSLFGDPRPKDGQDTA